MADETESGPKLMSPAEVAEEMWRAYRRSCDDVVTTTVVTCRDGTKTTTKRTNQIGDTELLRRCVDAEKRSWAEAKANINGPVLELPPGTHYAVPPPCTGDHRVLGVPRWWWTTAILLAILGVLIAMLCAQSVKADEVVAVSDADVSESSWEYDGAAKITVRVPVVYTMLREGLLVKADIPEEFRDRWEIWLTRTVDVTGSREEEVDVVEHYLSSKDRTSAVAYFNGRYEPEKSYVVEVMLHHTGVTAVPPRVIHGWPWPAVRGYYGGVRLPAVLGLPPHHRGHHKH